MLIRQLSYLYNYYLYFYLLLHKRLNNPYINEICLCRDVCSCIDIYAHVPQWLLGSAAARFFPGSIPGVRLIFFFKLSSYFIFGKK